MRISVVIFPMLFRSIQCLRFNNLSPNEIRYALKNKLRRKIEFIQNLQKERKKNYDKFHSTTKEKNFYEA